MATYIIDNGKDYSDHTVYFVAVPEEKRAAVEESVAKLNAAAGSEWKIFATVTCDLEWRAPAGPMTCEEFLADVAEQLTWYVDSPADVD